MSEALRLAERIDGWVHQDDMNIEDAMKAVAELRRLHEANQEKGIRLSERMKELLKVEAQRDELLEALRSLINICTHPNSTKAEMKQIAEESRKAIAAATKD